MPALAIDVCLVLVVVLVVADHVVAILVVFVKLIVSGLLRTLLLFEHDVVGVKHGLVFALRIKPELLLAACIRLLCAQFDDRLGKLVRSEILLVTRLLDLVNCRVSTLLEENVHHFSLQMPRKHPLYSFQRSLLALLVENLLLGGHEETGLGDGNLDELEQEKLDLNGEFFRCEVGQVLEH